MKVDPVTRLVDVTPVEKYVIAGKGEVLVKREDLCCPDPGPPFSKMRGVVRGLAALKEQGTEIVGYAETSISMACWGLSWAAMHQGVKVLAFMPQYKKGQPPLLDYHREQWEALGAETRPILKPNRGLINFYMARKTLREEFDDRAEMIVMGMPFPQTTVETTRQILLTPELADCRSLVINIGSGTICAGVLKGIDIKYHRMVKVYGVACRTYTSPRAIDDRIELVHRRAGLPKGGLLGPPFAFRNTKYDYTEPADIETPFPCNPFYDKKAWEWLVNNYDEIEKPVMFWNIGAGGTVPDE